MEEDKKDINLEDLYYEIDEMLDELKDQRADQERIEQLNEDLETLKTEFDEYKLQQEETPEEELLPEELLEDLPVELTLYDIYFVLIVIMSVGIIGLFKRKA